VYKILAVCVTYLFYTNRRSDVTQITSWYT